MLKVFIEHQPQFRGTAIYIYQRDHNGKLNVVQPLEFALGEAKEGYNYEPTLRFDGDDGSEFLRSLADALAEAGYRPSELQASDKELKATQYHLEDMRKLVFPR